MITLLGVSYRLESGELCAERPLEEFSRLAERAAISPFRLPVSYKGQAHFPGYLWMAANNTLVAYESRLEMMVLLHLDFTQTVRHVISQPFLLNYRFDLRTYHHTPDFLIFFKSGEIEVINVKPIQFVGKEANERAFSACKQAALEMSWAYSTRSELEPIFLTNLRWLSGYRREPPFFDKFAEKLVNAAIDSPSIKQIISLANGPPSLIRPVLFFLLWKRLLDFDFNKRLSESTKVGLPKGRS
jgi:hypothetical protein